MAPPVKNIFPSKALDFLPDLKTSIVNPELSFYVLTCTYHILHTKSKFTPTYSNHNQGNIYTLTSMTWIFTIFRIRITENKKVMFKVNASSLCHPQSQ